MKSGIVNVCWNCASRSRAGARQRRKRGRRIYAMRPIPLLLSALLFSAVVCGTEPWTDNDLVQPEQVSKDLRTPLLIHVGFPVLYRASHITGSVYAGPGSKEEGIADL